MTTQRRMTQQSRRQLEAADTVRISYVSGQDGYHVLMHRDPERCDYVLTASDGPMVYSTPAAAMRAIRRIRPDLSDAEIPITWESRPGLYPQDDRQDAERIIEELHLAQEVAQKLFDGLTRDPATCDTPHAFYARSLVGRLMMLESELLASPPRTDSVAES